VPVVASAFADVRELAANDTDIVARRAAGSVGRGGRIRRGSAATRRSRRAPGRSRSAHELR
jgi:hypothetical protein